MGYSAPTSSTIAATSRWAAHGTISTSRRSAGKRSGKIRPKATRRRRPTNGGTGTTAMSTTRRRTGSGSRYRMRARRRSGTSPSRKRPGTSFVDLLHRDHFGPTRRFASAQFHAPASVSGKRKLRERAFDEPRNGMQRVGIAVAARRRDLVDFLARRGVEEAQGHRML